MIKSMFSAVTGLKTHQTMMDVIGNNIANVNTAGFSASRVLFKDMYYQTLSSASEATDNLGGTNPMQLGYGTTVGTIQVTNNRSGYQQTSRSLDLYIAGDGYFTITDSSGTMKYTRVGAFDFDASGNLVDANGNFVVGMYSDSDGNVVLDKIKIDDFEDYVDIAINAAGVITGKNTLTGDIEQLGQLSLAVFNNPGGLAQNGNQYYSVTENSGDAVFTVAGSDLAGPLLSGALEMSNVDLSKEFTDMIVAQRGFQANSRVITTSDQILEELINLKR
jgi:flagellar hook protein FlgE